MFPQTAGEPVEFEVNLDLDHLQARLACVVLFIRRQVLRLAVGPSGPHRSHYPSPPVRRRFPLSQNSHWQPIWRPLPCDIWR